MTGPPVRAAALPGCLLLLCGLAAPGAALLPQAGGEEPGAGGPPVATSVRAEAPPVIDGRLDDPAWEAAEPLSGFLQRLPREGAPASQRTEVRLLHDDRALFVGIWLWDSEPHLIVDGEAIRNAPLDDSDAVLLVLDTFHDQRNGFVFGTNPSGIEYDGQISNEGEGGGGMGGRFQRGAGGGVNLNWDGSWEVATSRDERGWYAEFRIPFSTLRYGQGEGEGQVWGLNVMRRIRRVNEESLWAPVARQHSVFRLSSAGVLRGLAPPPQRFADVTPYALGSAHRDDRAGDDSFSYPGEFGADAKVQVTDGLTLDLTWNTDFAQVEVDEEQVDLTRFSLRFPEKRPFFLENAGFFNVGTGQAELFFSRRIGLREGEPVPIRGGGRLSGRAAGLNVGALHIRTGSSDAEGVGAHRGDAFSVLRLARELPNRTRVGVFLADRTARGLDGAYNRTYAVDGQLGIGEALTLSSFAARTDTPGRRGRDHSLHLSAEYQDREWRSWTNYREVGEDFNPEVGFLPRRDYRTYSGFVMRYLRPEGLSWIREIRPHVSYNTFRSLETGFEQSARLHVDAHVEHPSGAEFSPAFNWVREGLEAPFPIAEGIVVQPGTYDGWEAAWRLNTDESAALSFSGGLDAGHFLSGRRIGLQGTVSARRGSSVAAALGVERNDLRLAEGAFTVNLATARLAYYVSPRVFVQSLVQYNDQIDTWSANVRFGWLDTAGTGLFVVLNDARGFNTLSGPLSRSLVVKYTRRFNVWKS